MATVPEDTPLQESIEKLERRLARINSWQHIFFRGIISGIGTAVGASLIAGVSFALLFRFLSSAGFLPYVDTLLETMPRY